MDVHRGRYFGFGRFRLRLGIPPISRGFIRILPATESARRKTLACTLMTAALLLALIAHRISANEALLTWKKNHTPSLKLWTQALSIHGLSAVSGPEAIHRIMKEMPASLDNRGAAWLSESLDAVVVYDNDADVLPHVFASTKPSHKGRAFKPRAWAPAGLGWDGFHHILTQLEYRPPTHAPRPSKKANDPTDPRMIQY